MIDIVLATYNGQRFLVEQVQSIQQSDDYQALVSRFIIVDDGSSDDTLQLAEQLAAQDNKIEVLTNHSGLHGPSNNFAFGLEQTTAEYIMLSDQDDIWLPEKIALSFKTIQQREQGLKETPILVFTDKLIVDESLRVMCESYFKLKNIPKTWHQKFNQLCQQNVVSGCTTLFNRALLNKAMPIPEMAYMHDWWLALVASRCGELYFIDQALIKYRQHDSNAIGAREKTLLSLILYCPRHFMLFKKSFKGVTSQAIAFQEFEKKHEIKADPTIYLLANMQNFSKFKIIGNFINGSVTRCHFLGKLVLLMLLLTIKCQKNIK